jgi:hypothetical protein
MSDGRNGESFNEIPTGTTEDQLTFTQNGNYPPNITMKKSGGWGGGRPAENKDASFALAYAKDIVVAMIARSESPMKSADAAKVATATAAIFLKFLKENK